MAFPRLLSLPRAVIGVVFLVLYVTLDWASFVQPFGPFGITPWNPSIGVGLVLILVFGQRFLPLLFVGPFLAEVVVRHLPAPLPIELVLCAAIGGGYSAATLALLRPGLRFQLSLSSMRDMAVLMVTAAVSAAAVAAALVAILASSGLLPWRDVPSAALRYWVGDVIGIAVVTPFLLILLTRGRPLHAGPETVLQVAAILAALAVVFASGAGQELQLFYLLFVPIVWIAVRAGLEGVTAGLVVTQLGLMTALHLFAPQDLNVTAFQTLMLVLAFTGLATGVLVTERRRAELQLRLQQEAQARIARLGSMGELAAALAHEINQPLMAAGTYTRLAAANLDGEGGRPELAREAAEKAVRQVERATDVVRRLRDLIRLGRSEIAPVPIQRLLKGAVDLVGPELARGDIVTREDVPSDLPAVLADALQIEQVLINVLRNAVEAIVGAGHRHGTITISAARAGDMVELCVRDSGPGFTDAQLAQPAMPFNTTKPEGLGVGLSLCRTIVDAHGGRLWIGSSHEGADVHIALPIAEPRSP